MTIEKQLYERQMELIFRMLLENKTNEEIASELGISIRTVQNYKQRLDKRYGAAQAKKTDDTLFLECQIFKNRMLKLFANLEKVVSSRNPQVTGHEKAKCAEIAANIAIDVLKMESEGIKAVQDLISIEKKNNTLISKNSRSTHSSNDNKNTENNGYENESIQEQEYDNDNRKF